MVHDESGEIGSIDAGDLILVHGRDPQASLPSPKQPPLTSEFWLRHARDGR